jgi:hypothetical protein
MIQTHGLSECEWKDMWCGVIQDGVVSLAFFTLVISGTV